MTKKLLAAALLLFTLLQAHAATYTFRSDSYAWESAANAIATWDRTCTSYPGDDDKATITFTGGFTFTFAGTAYNSVRVLTNGGLQFGTDTGFFRTYTNTALPAGTAGASSAGCAAAATTNVILAYWTDLNPSQAGSGGVTWEQKGTLPNRYVVISWNGVYQYNTSTPYTFQIILYENGEFKFQYGNANASGSKATIGVQVSTSDYTQYSYNSGYNANGSAIRWFVASGTPTRLAEYRFDEYGYSGRVGEVKDSTTNSNNGVRVGNATTSATAKVCRSLSIPANTTGTSDAADTLLNVSSSIGNSGAVTLWYYANTAWNSAAAMLLDATLSTAQPFFLVRQADGSLRATLTDSAGTTLTATTSALGLGAASWQHVAFSWRLAAGSGQSSIRIYLNGNQVGAVAGTTNGTLSPGLGTLFVGDNRSASAPTGATLFSANGLIDELRVYNYEISAIELTADMNPNHVCPPPLDHYELSVPANSLTCLPTTITVTACTNNTSPCTAAEPSVNGTAVLTTTAGTLGNTPISFTNGVATTTLNLPGGADGTAVTVTLGSESSAAANSRQCCPSGSNCYVANSCPTTFNRAGFIVAAQTGGAAVTLPAQVAGTPSAAPSIPANSTGNYYLRAVKASTTTQACEAAVTGNRNVNWAYQCNDPATCSASNLMTVNTSANTTIQRNNASVAQASLAYTAVPMTFDANGNAPFKLTFLDVGRTTLFFNFAAGNGDVISTASGSSFVTKPAGFTVTQITTPGGVANPGGLSATPGVFVKAGAPFSARITAVTSTNVATLNFGKESTPEGVLLTPTLVAPLATPTSNNVTGTVGGATVAGSAFTNGVANVTNLSYSEVGVMTLKGSVADGDYLGAGDTTASSASENIGRFIPAGFTVTAGAATQRVALACPAAATPTFTYLDENFRLNFTLNAVNTLGVVTKNYAGAYARLALGAAADFNLAGVDTLPGATRFDITRLALGPITGAWPAVGSGAAGTAAITLTAAALRAPAPGGPYRVNFGIAPVEQVGGDGVGMLAFDIDTDPAVAGNDRTSVGQIPLRQGRLRLQNGMSAANRDLKLALTAQYWNGTAFVTNDLDSCSTVIDTNLSFGNFRKQLGNADAAMVPATVTVNPNAPTFITLRKPGGGRVGSLDVAIALGSTAADKSCLKTASNWVPAIPASTAANLPGLRAAWCGAGGSTSDPGARATWGLSRGSDGIVFQRENY